VHISAESGSVLPECDIWQPPAGPPERRQLITLAHKIIGERAAAGQLAVQRSG
jgi:hypothetical protein